MYRMYTQETHRQGSFQEVGFSDYLWLACLLEFIIKFLSKPYPAIITTYAVPIKLKPTQLKK